jgi:hypothetical protein
MTVKEKDHLKKVSCKIDSMTIKDGLLYYCKKKELFYIFNNDLYGATPENYKDVLKKYGYRGSWAYQDIKGNKISNLTNLKFLDEGKIYELWA